jgi:hypothetical protein
MHAKLAEAQPQRILHATLLGGDADALPFVSPSPTAEGGDPMAFSLRRIWRSVS